MHITNKCMITGKMNTRWIEGLTEEAMEDWGAGGQVIQEAMPDVSPEDREFIMTGITPEVWAQQFPQEPALIADLWACSLGTEEIVLTMGS
jgi:hypothetical protein